MTDVLTPPPLTLAVGRANFAPSDVLYVERFRTAGMSDFDTLAATFAAVTGNGMTIRCQPGRTYDLTGSGAFTATLSGISDPTIDGCGATIVNTSVTGEIFTVQGAVNPSLTTVTTAIAKGARTIVVGSAPGVTAGSIITIRSDAEVFNPDRPGQYIKGELGRVQSVTGTSITLTAPTRDSYSITGFTVTVGLMNPVRNLRVNRLNVVGGGAGFQQFGLQVRYFDGATFDQCTATDTEQTGMLGWVGFDLHGNRTRSTRCAMTTLGYGIKAAGVQGVTFSRHIGESDRHSVDVDSGNPFPCRDVNYHRCVANNATSSGISTHGACEDVVITDCSTSNCGGGIITRGRRTRIERCTIRGSKTTIESAQSYSSGIIVGDDGSWSWGTGFAGTDLVITDNTIDVSNPRWTTDAQTSHGIYCTSALVNARISDNTIRGFSGHGITSKGDYGDGLRVTGNTIECASQVASLASGFLHGMYLSPAHVVAGNRYQRVRIRDNQIKGALYSGVRLDGDTAAGTAFYAEDIEITDNSIGYGQWGVDIGLGKWGSAIVVDRNSFPDLTATAATAVRVGAATQYLRYPSISTKSIAGRVVSGGSARTGPRMRGGLAYSTTGTGLDVVQVAGSLYVTPIEITRAVTITSLSVVVKAAGATGASVRLGVYADIDDGVGGYPAARLLDAGPVAADTTGRMTVACSLTLPPGLYWLAGVAQGGNPTCAGINGPNPLIGLNATTSTFTTYCGYRMTGVTAALPDLFTATEDAQGGIMLITARIA